jgi:hypothetical protein
MPTDAEIDKLLVLVGEAHPKLRPRQQDDAEYRQSFVLALHCLAYARRSDLNSKYAVSYFLDAGNEWLRKHQPGSAALSLKSFYAAAISSGIRHTAPTNFPYDLELGLGLGETTQPVAGWREILTAGKVPPPSESKRRLAPQVTQANLTRVIVAGKMVVGGEG